MTSSGRQVVGKRLRLRNRIIYLLMLLLVGVVMVCILFLYQHYPEMIAALRGYGYLGAFFISMIFNATVVLPVGNALVIATLGATLPSATMVGLASATGATIGEMTGYVTGYSGQAIVVGHKTYDRLEGWVKRWGAPTIFFLSIIPFVFDLAGIAAGILRFPLWKFLVACFLGRLILYLGIAWAGAQGWEALLRYLSRP